MKQFVKVCLEPISKIARTISQFFSAANGGIPPSPRYSSGEAGRNSWAIPSSEFPVFARKSLAICMCLFLRWVLLFLALAPPFAFAGSASSTNFKIDTDVITVGGQRATSTSFGLESSLGQPATGISSSTSFILRGGFLYFPTITIIVAPNAPSNLVAVANSATSVSITWTDNSSNTEGGFSVERKTGVGGTYAEIGRVATGVTSSTDTAASAATTYFYRVRAFIGNVYSSYSNESSVTTPSSATASSSVTTPSSGGGGGAFTVGNDNIAAHTTTFHTTASPCNLIGDFNCVGRVNIIDFSIMTYWYGRSNPPAAVDLNHDGKIDLIDFSILAYYWTG